MKIPVAFILICSALSGAVEASQTAEKQKPWTEKCKSSENFYYDASRRSGNCSADGESSDSDLKGFKDRSYTNCAAGSTLSVKIRYVQGSSGSLFGSAATCSVTEIRMAQRKDGSKFKERNIEVISADGTRRVVAYDMEKDEPENLTIYTKEGMLTCDTYDKATKKFKWCGVVDPDRPSTDSKPYTGVDASILDRDVEQSLLTANKKLGDIFPVAAKSSSGSSGAFFGSRSSGGSSK